MQNRTAKGNVTAQAYKTHGNANTPAERASIIRRAAKYAPEAAQKAREADKK